jgi:hypothetical protein
VKGELGTQPPKIIGKRALAGLWLIFASGEVSFHPAPNLLNPSDEGEAAGLIAACIASAVLGTLLIVPGFQARFKERFVDDEGSRIGR